MDPECSPVWQYLLLMCLKAQAIAQGIMDTGANWDQATLEANVKFIDTFLDQWEDLAEKSTGWKEGGKKTP